MLNMTSDNFVSGNNSFKSHLNAKTVAVVRSTLILLQYKGGVNSVSGENWKKHHSMAIVMKKFLM